MDHHNLSSEINAAIAESELQGGVFIDKLLLGHSLKVTTQNTKYLVERREDGVYMSGHYKYCPKPVKVHSLGSNFGGSMLKVGFIGRGMYMEFFIDMPEEERHRGIVDGHGRIVTSKITEMEEV